MIIPQTGPIMDLGDGPHDGSLLLSHHDGVIRGNGPGRTFLRGDGHFGSVVQGFMAGGVGCRGVTLQRMTIDGRYLVGALLESNAACENLILDDVVLRGIRYGGMGIDNRGRLQATNVRIESEWTGIQIGPGSTLTHVRHAVIRSRGYGVVVSDGPAIASIPGIDLDDVAVATDYWACPSSLPSPPPVMVMATSLVLPEPAPEDELAEGAYARAWIPVETFDVTDPDQMRRARAWDLAELPDGRYAQVLTVAGGVAIGW